MLDWLNTTTTPENAPPQGPAQDSGKVRGSPVFPVSRFRETSPGNAEQPEKPHDFRVFPVSRFSRFENGGEPAQDPGREENGGATAEDLPGLLDALAARLAPDEVGEVRTLGAENPTLAAQVCRLILASPPFPSSEDAAELDRLIVRLCELEPWLAGFQGEMQAARLSMAPALIHIDLARFREWVRAAEAKHGAAPVGAGDGQPSALYDGGSVSQAQATGNHQGKVSGPACGSSLGSLTAGRKRRTEPLGSTPGNLGNTATSERLMP